MSARPSRRPVRSRSTTGGALAVCLIALLIALVATIQLRSQAEVERSLQSADPASLAFSIDQLHRANESLDAQITALNHQVTALQSGGSGAADQQLAAEANQLRMLEGLVDHPLAGAAPPLHAADEPARHQRSPDAQQKRR